MSKHQKPVPFDPVQSSARARRETHFAKGGTVAMWRGCGAGAFKDRRIDAIEAHARRVDLAVRGREYD